MDRRSFIAAGAATFVASEMRGLASDTRRDPGRHRFGVNYTPSQNWWFCWNDWAPDSMLRDLDAIAALGADHLRILLIWPFFQPNAQWVSPAHLDRMEDLLRTMAQRNLDAVITVFTGQLSGLYFLPPFTYPYGVSPSTFYTDEAVWQAQQLFVRALGQRIANHENVIGFDFGNEVNTCWPADTPAGDAWMTRMASAMQQAMPQGLHVNGVDHQPWFRQTTFSARALAAQKMPAIHCYPWWTGALKYGGPMDPPSVQLISAMAALVRAFAGDPQKPVWCEEFNTCIEALDERGQGAWLEKAATSAIDNGVGWFTYWDSHDVNRRYKFAPMEYSLGLLTNDGRVKQQGLVFKDLARSYRGRTVSMPRRALPPPPAERTVDATWRWILDWINLQAQR
jgi:endo-1,4-beta-mannosidase